MRLSKTVPAALLLTGGPLASIHAVADDSVFTVMDDPSSAKKPFGGNLNAGYLARLDDTKSSLLTADTAITWYSQTAAWSLWGNVSNASLNGECSSEKYAIDGRSRYDMTDYDYLFGQASRLTDRYDDYRECDVLTAGYGRQFLDGPVHSSRFEFDPGVCYNEHTDGTTETQSLGCASGAYAWQMTDNIKFTQGVSVFGTDDTTLDSEAALNAIINERFGLKMAYNVTWNSESPATTLEHTDHRMTVSLGYQM